MLLTPVLAHYTQTGSITRNGIKKRTY